MLSKEFLINTNYQASEFSDYAEETLENGVHTFNYVDINDIILNEKPPINQVVVNYNEVGIENIHFISQAVSDSDNEEITFYFTHQNKAYLMLLTKALGSYYVEALRGESISKIQQTIKDTDPQTAELLQPFIEKESLEKKINSFRHKDTENINKLKL
jgi:hypothetical protein